MRVLIIGSGGREHALIWKIAQSPRVEKIYCIPGNGGIASLAACIEKPLDDFTSIVRFAKDKRIDMTVVGPEAPLAAGIVDCFRENKLGIFGPDKKAARLEGSKVFAKRFMERHGIPTAKFRVFTDSKEAVSHIKGISGSGMVIKADGLAAGKGVLVCDSREDAIEAVDLIMVKKAFGDAGNSVLIEEKLQGEEASLMAFCDGKSVVPMLASQDHKRVYDGDKGPNTGGMGAYAPVPLVDEPLYARAKKEIFDNFLDGIKNEKLTFRGIIYAGIMVTQDGPKVLEFNVRFGDPETEVVLPLLDTDITELFEASVKGELDRVKIAWSKKSCVCVVISSGGYPDKYEKGLEISGLTDVRGDGNVIVFHAGTKKENDRILTSGGRVLGVTGLGNSLKTAIKTVYKGVEKIKFSRMYYRKDIGAKGLRRGI